MYSDSVVQLTPLVQVVVDSSTSQLTPSLQVRWAPFEVQVVDAMALLTVTKHPQIKTENKVLICILQA
jgi:hypothetical protein